MISKTLSSVSKESFDTDFDIFFVIFDIFNWPLERFSTFV